MAHTDNPKETAKNIPFAQYQSADDFFQANWPHALTYDDVSLATNFSDVLPRQTVLETYISEKLHLQVPLISADMDTVTEADMAIGMALNGGLGLIHYNMSEEEQRKEVAKVKNHVHGLIQEPISIAADWTIGQVIEMIERKDYSFSTFPVVDPKRKLVGLLPGRIVRQRYADSKVADAMTPRSMLKTIQEDELGDTPIQKANDFFRENMGITKLLVISNEDELRGLFTISDVDRIVEESKSLYRPARDSSFRLLCGAAVSTPRKPDGELDVNRLINHVGSLVDEGVDAIAVSTAHGHSKGVGDAVRIIRSTFAELTLIAGNVTSREGVEFLSEAGADSIKVGQGPGSICTTRVVAGVGIPQLTALYTASRAQTKRRVSLIADGGITKSGDIVKALTLADAVICGGLFAGCREAPGEILEIDGKLYKQYRGMGSHAAMKAGSAARYGHDNQSRSKTAKVAAEGIEALKEVSGVLDETIAQLVGGIQSGMGYLGAKNLCEHKQKARYIRVSPAGMKEAAPHDVIEVKAGQK